MRIATFNINNVNRRMPLLLSWLTTSMPDVVCLQELKCAQVKFPARELEEAGYESVWVGQPSWNGVAILSRIGTPVVTRTALPGDPTDEQARYIEAAVAGTLVGCLYAPNGNPRPGPKFDYKLNWHDRLNRHGRVLLSADIPVVLAGDYNVAPEPRDIYDTYSYDDNALVQPETRKAFRDLVRQGWTDAIRSTHGDERIYTFWDYRRNRWQRDAGLRLDHILLSPTLASQAKEANVDRGMRGVTDASDHAPVWVELNLS